MGKRYSTLNKGFKPDRQKGNRKKKVIAFLKAERKLFKKNRYFSSKVLFFQFFR